MKHRGPSPFHRARQAALAEAHALVAIQPSDRPWQLPLAAALASGGPIAAGAAVGEIHAGAIGPIAGLAALYLPATPLRQRIPLIIACATAMWASFAAGLAAAGSSAGAIGVTALVAIAAMWFCKVNRLLPPGPLFMVMAAAIAAFLPVGREPAGGALGYFAAGCLWACAVAVGYSLAIVRLRVPVPMAPVSPAERRSAAGDALLAGLFVALSLLVATMLALDKPYWVPVSCLAVMQGLTLRASWTRNVHRIVGTAIGLCLTALILPWTTSPWAAAATVLVLTWLIETAVVRNYAFAAMFITPLTIILAESSAAGQANLADLMSARLIDTAIGALIGLAGALCLHHPKFRRPFDRLLGWHA